MARALTTGAFAAEAAGAWETASAITEPPVPMLRPPAEEVEATGITKIQKEVLQNKELLESLGLGEFYGEESVKHLGMWGNFESNELGHADYNAIVNNLYYNKSNEFSRLYNTLQIGRELFADKTNYFDGSFFCETAHYGKCYDRFGFKNGARDLVHAGPEDLEKIANEIKTIMDNEIIK